MIPTFPTRQTKRLLLRKLSKNDAQQVFNIRSNPIVEKHLSRPLADTIEDAYEHIEKIKQLERKGECIYWVISCNDQYLGSVTLWNFNDEKTEADIGYELFPIHQGYGYVTEAVTSIIEYATQHLQLQKIIAVTIEKNTKSIRLLEKFNFNLDVRNPDGSIEYSLNLQ